MVHRVTMTNSTLLKNGILASHSSALWQYVFYSSLFTILFYNIKSHISELLDLDLADPLLQILRCLVAADDDAVRIQGIWWSQVKVVCASFNVAGWEVCTQTRYWTGSTPWV